MPDNQPLPENEVPYPVTEPEIACALCGKLHRPKMANAERSVCRACQGAESQAKKEIAISQIKRDALLAAIAKTRPTKQKMHVDLPTMQGVLGDMMSMFGGQTPFVTIWHKQIMQACEEKPGSKTALDALARVANMVMEVEKEKNRREEAHMLTDAALDEELRSLTMREMLRIVDAEVIDEPVPEYDPEKFQELLEAEVNKTEDAA